MQFYYKGCGEDFKEGEKPAYIANRCEAANGARGPGYSGRSSATWRLPI